MERCGTCFSFALDVQFHTFGSLSCMSSDGIGLVELLDALMPWTRPVRSIMIPLCFQGRGSIADQAGLGQDKELEFAPLLHSGANFDLEPPNGSSLGRSKSQQRSLCEGNLGLGSSGSWEMSTFVSSRRSQAKA